MPSDSVHIIFCRKVWLNFKERLSKLTFWFAFSVNPTISAHDGNDDEDDDDERQKTSGDKIFLPRNRWQVFWEQRRNELFAGTNYPGVVITCDANVWQISAIRLIRGLSWRSQTTLESLDPGQWRISNDFRFQEYPNKTMDVKIVWF